MYDLEPIGDYSQDKTVGYLWAMGLCLSAVGQVYSLARMNSSAANLSLKVKAALGGLVYRKALRLKGTEGISKAVDLISRDLDRFQDGFLYFHYTWGSLPEMVRKDIENHIFDTHYRLLWWCSLPWRWASICFLLQVSFSSSFPSRLSLVTIRTSIRCPWNMLLEEE